MLSQSTVDRLKTEYETARQRTDTRFPGSFAVGPARYPVERHNKAHARVRRLYEEWQEAKNRLERSIAHAEDMKQKAEFTDAIAGDFITSLKPGDEVLIRWTNCGYQHEGTARVRKINARTIVCELIKDIPGKHGGYKAGQYWPMPKIGTPGNCILPA